MPAAGHGREAQPAGSALFSTALKTARETKATGSVRGTEAPARYSRQSLRRRPARHQTGKLVIRVAVPARHPPGQGTTEKLATKVQRLSGDGLAMTPAATRVRPVPVRGGQVSDGLPLPEGTHRRSGAAAGAAPSDPPGPLATPKSVSVRTGPGANLTAEHPVRVASGNEPAPGERSTSPLGRAVLTLPTDRASKSGPSVSVPPETSPATAAIVARSGAPVAPGRTRGRWTQTLGLHAASGRGTSRPATNPSGVGPAPAETPVRGVPDPLANPRPKRGSNARPDLTSSEAPRLPASSGVASMGLDSPVRAAAPAFLPRQADAVRRGAYASPEAESAQVWAQSADGQWVRADVRTIGSAVDAQLFTQSPGLPLGARVAELQAALARHDLSLRSFSVHQGGAQGTGPDSGDAGRQAYGHGHTSRPGGNAGTALKPQQATESTETVGVMGRGGGSFDARA